MGAILNGIYRQRLITAVRKSRSDERELGKSSWVSAVLVVETLFPAPVFGVKVWRGGRWLHRMLVDEPKMSPSEEEG